MASKYEKCKSNMINKILKEFESDKLKSSSGNKVKTRQQALAIGISMSESKCNKHIDSYYLERLKIKVDKFIFNNKKIKKDKVSYSGINDVIKYIKLTKKHKYKNLLVKRFLLSISFNTHQLNNKISKLVYNIL
jgi:hypothetical protein